MKPDIDKLLNATNSNNSIIELDSYICGLRFDRMTEQQKNFYYNQELEREVNNGGFHLYFINSPGEFAHQTVTSLHIIGARKTADILQKAINQFPNGEVPADRKQRRYLITQLGEKTKAAWVELTHIFFAHEDNLTALNLNYVKHNRDAF